MIGVVSAIVGGALMNSYIPLILPLIYLLKRFNKDLAILTFSAYLLGLSYSINVSSIYSREGALAIFAIALPNLLVLDSLLREGFPDFNEKEFALSLALIASYINEYAFIALLIITLVMKFHGDFIWREPLGAALLTGAFLYYFRAYFENDYVGQVVTLITASILTFSLLAMRKDVKREKMFSA
ncbi:hypothetical protein [Palaeococcus sp. (in: euryarchaeotes)]